MDASREIQHEAFSVMIAKNISLRLGVKENIVGGEEFTKAPQHAARTPPNL
ncbi:MAG TPA: hypothetical protein VHQ47_18175 [Phycisphaerae bacterium]|nr:hypothetical protein [Phycisphaerae bacterium]